MKTGLSLTELATKIERNRDQKHDFIADTTHMLVREHEANLTLNVKADGATYPILPVAHDQIAAHTTIPRDFYNRLKDGKTDGKTVIVPQRALLAHNVNTLFVANPQRRMVRTMNGNMRAFLSNRYQRIENEQIAEAALPVLMDLPVEIVSSEITDKRLYIHFTVPTVQGEVKKGDVVQAGGIIQNSEVGLGSVSVAGLIWRLICLNGLKMQEAYRRNHVGRAVDDSEELWADDTRKADDNAVLLKVRDMVRAVVDESRFRANLGRLQNLTEGKIEGDPAKAIEVLAKKVGATENERGGILRALIEGGDLSRWGVVNAVTAQAHNTADYDRAVEFESMGASIIDLPPSEWREILLAA
jgi:hypothetical protein